MINGLVNGAGQACIELVVRGPDGDAAVVQAMVDTGFNGLLTIPGSMIRSLKLSGVGSSNVVLADDKTASWSSFEAWVYWHGRSEQVEVLEAEGLPLAGMSLLLLIDVVENG